MKPFSFVYFLCPLILSTNCAWATAQHGRQLAKQVVSKTVFAQSSAVGPKQLGSDRSMIIVSGKNAKSGSVASPGSKVMLNPQPLPPRTNDNPSSNSNAAKVMLNPQPLPPKVNNSLK
jgi:hypothetical protein